MEGLRRETSTGWHTQGALPGPRGPLLGLFTQRSLRPNSLHQIPSASAWTAFDPSWNRYKHVHFHGKVERGGQELGEGHRQGATCRRTGLVPSRASEALQASGQECGRVAPPWLERKVEILKTEQELDSVI
jgi:hypothetical protein